MRAPALLALLLLVTLPLAVLPAAAQLPPNPGAAAVSVELPATGVVSAEKATRLTATVCNAGQATDTPLDQPREVHLEVTGAPEGWSAVLSPTLLRLAPQACGSASLSLTVIASSETQAASITVTARLLPLGASGVPGVGSTLDPEASDAATVQATRDDPVQRNLVETIGPDALLALLGGLALLCLLLAVLAMRRRGPLRISCEPQALTVQPGGSATVAVTVRNAGSRNENVLLDGAASRGWEVEIPEHVLEMPGGSSHTVDVVVAASKRATASDLVLVAISQRPGAAPARVTLPLATK